MTRACAWCDDENGVDRSGEIVTHGICQRHLDEQLWELEIKKRIRTARAMHQYAQEELTKVLHGSL